MLQKHPDQYADEELEAWVRRLVDERIAEGPMLDYKATIDLRVEKNKLEAAKDISSFANEIGGTIIYGIPEDRQSENIAIPKEPYGMDPIPGLEEQLGNIVVDSILPHLPEYRIKKVELTKYPGKVVYIAWTPESWLAPHMVSAYADKRYYRRGQLRAVRMEEHEIRQRYERIQRLKGPLFDFLQSMEHSLGLWRATHHQQQPFAVSYLLCPVYLETGRVDFSSPDIRGWLRTNIYSERTLGGSEWTPCLEGVEASLARRGIEVTIYPTGAVSRFTIRSDDDVQDVEDSKHIILRSRAELKEIWDFTQFGARLFQKISYSGPLSFRVTIFSSTPLPLAIVLPGDLYAPRERVPLLRSLLTHPYIFEAETSGANLMNQPRSVVKAIADKIWWGFGMWEAPPLDNRLFWNNVF